MSDLEKETVDTLIQPIPNLGVELELEGSDNMLNQNQFLGNDEVDLLGEGVPGYETTGETTPMDTLEDQIEEEEYSPHPPK